jgi:DNA-binding transcriptional regulator of glucitol operon
MAGWLIVLLKLGGFAVMPVIAVAVMGWWLWSKINNALGSYTNKYLEQKAEIDARL